MYKIAPTLPVVRSGYKFSHLGSEYGGWIFVDSENLYNAVVVSCGVGEDVSFDVEFASHYGAKVILVDPTPRAIRHFKNVEAHLGEPQKQPGSKGGKQSVDSYDLSKLSPGQIRLCEKALWNSVESVKFFAPRNPDHVSHSIGNYQNNYVEDTKHIMVTTTTIDKLLDEFVKGKPALIKLDIEGAEIEVLLDMLSKGIHPRQVLVEYDELSVPSKISKARVEAAHSKLLDAGYLLVHRHQNNFTYFHAN